MAATFMDEVTSLPNHLFFNQILNNALVEAKRHDSPLALLFIKVENFFSINTHYGSDISNLALQELGRHFKSLLGFEDSLVRFEIDEFSLLLPNIANRKSVDRVIEKLLTIGTNPLDIENHDIQFELKLGIAIFPEDGETLETLEKNASQAQSRVKTNNKHYQYYHHRQSEVDNNMELQAALTKAFSNKEFMLYYQPKLHLKEKKITGVEALVRWNHPQYGMLTPNQFISVAESAGLMSSLGAWILQEACQTNKEWQNLGYKPIMMSVNLSPEQFHDPELPNLIEKTLQESGLDPRFLDLEITEMTVLEDTHHVNDFFSRMKTKGISISIDDFGIGHTSIQHLKAFPINVLKIDQSYIKNLPDNQKNVAITCEMLSLAQELGIQVVAEGVENIEQIEFLATKNCDMVQGYFISRPLPAAQVVALLEK